MLKDFSESMISYRTALISHKIGELSFDNDIEDESEMFDIYERLFKLHFNGIETYPSMNAPQETIAQFPSEKDQLEALNALSQLRGKGQVPKELETLIALLGGK